MQELLWQLHGARTRQAQIQYGSRQIWVYLHNALNKTKYRTPEQLHNVWPLYTDNIKRLPPEQQEANMIATYRALKEKLTAKNK